VPNRRLTSEELIKAHELLADIRSRLKALARDDLDLLFAYRRKVFKELGYDERSKPSARTKLKILKWRLQSGKCAECGKDLPVKNCDLDRLNAANGYTVENTELLHTKCHVARQRAKNYG
jgi:hypothetical protein